MGKVNILGIMVDAVDYETAAQRVIERAREGRAFAATALAVHGVMTGFLDKRHKYRLNTIDMVTPDGQPVRWAMNILHGAGLQDRVYGPELMLRICEKAEREGIPIYLYGSHENVLMRMASSMMKRYPRLVIAGRKQSLFRRMTEEETARLAREVVESGAKILFVGIGCPRQEIFIYELKEALNIPMIAVGAAYDFHAGTQKQAPPIMQKYGLEWFYRLINEPARLWRRYVLLNPLYMVMVTLQALGAWRPDPHDSLRPIEYERYG